MLHFDGHEGLPALHSFPTRRSSDLVELDGVGRVRGRGHLGSLRSTACALSHVHVKHTECPGSCLTRCETTNRLQNRSEEHTSELQSQFHLVCRLLLEKKKKKRNKSA